MPDILTQHNIAALVDLRRLTDHSTATAGGTGAGTQVVGLTVDRMGMGTGSLAQSALMGVIYETTLAAGDTLSLAYEIDSSPDGSTWTNIQSATAAVVATGPTGGGTIKSEFNVAADLTGAARYVRFSYTPTFSAPNTDTFYGDGVGAFGGFARLAAPNT